ncbi:MAG: hypothetical protein RLP44_14255 [Aggregatilineales bacterium]
MKRIFCLPLLLLIAGCGALDRTDAVGTLNADTTIYETQVSQIALDGLSNQTQVAQTVVAAETEVASQSQINRDLLQMVSAGSTPTITISRLNSAQSNVGQTGSANPQVTTVPFNSDQQSFVVTGTSTSVDPSDGCMLNARTTFDIDEDQVYMTARALNLAEGTLMAVEWMRDGTMVWQDTWLVDDNYADICVWFFLIPSYVPFTAGTWSAQFFADNAPIGNAVQFVFDDM